MNLDKKTLKILKRIYHCPYITLAEMKTIFPARDTEELILFLEKENYISFRIADSSDSDEGYSPYGYGEDTHLLSILKGNIASEDDTALRANAALAVSILALLIAVLTFFFK